MARVFEKRRKAVESSIERLEAIRKQAENEKGVP
jgi:hypothetical protein